MPHSVDLRKSCPSSPVLKCAVQMPPMQTQDLENVLNRVHTWTNQVDEKVNILLAAQVAVLGFLFDPLIDWFKAAHWSYRISLGIAVALQVGGIWQAGRVLFPNTKNPHPKKSVTFFADIASRPTAEDYRRELAAMKPEDWEQEFIDQIHVCARIVTEKFQHFKKSILIAGAGLAWLAGVYFVYQFRG